MIELKIKKQKDIANFSKFLFRQILEKLMIVWDRINIHRSFVVTGFITSLE